MRFCCLLGLLFTLAGNTAAAETIALISDINGRYGSTTYHARVGKAMDTILAMKPVAVLSAGDMVAGQKQPKLDRAWLDEMWSVFNAEIRAPLANAGVPFLITPGNHDGSAFPAFQLEREQFIRQWSAPDAGVEILPGSDWPLRYAARLGQLLIIAFDGTRPGTLPGAEREFLEQALDRHSPNAAMTVVMSHLPMWPLAKGREHEIIADPSLLTLLHRHGVDVYASGHHHVFYPGVDEAGMVHLAVGALGGNARTFASGRQKQKHSLALLEFDGKSIRISARRAPEFSADVPLDSLPALVNGPLGQLRRLDGVAALKP